MFTHKEIQRELDDYVSIDVFAKLAGLPVSVVRNELVTRDSEFFGKDTIPMSELRKLLLVYLNSIFVLEPSLS